MINRLTITLIFLFLFDEGVLLGYLLGQIKEMWPLSHGVGFTFSRPEFSSSPACPPLGSTPDLLAATMVTGPCTSRWYTLCGRTNFIR